MISTSQVVEYLRAGGCELHIYVPPLRKELPMNAVQSLQLPHLHHHESWRLMEFMVLYCFLDSNWSYRNSRALFIGLYLNLSAIQYTNCSIVSK